MITDATAALEARVLMGFALAEYSSTQLEPCIMPPLVSGLLLK
jgi:hypothetical protein